MLFNHFLRMKHTVLISSFFVLPLAAICGETSTLSKYPMTVRTGFVMDFCAEPIAKFAPPEIIDPKKPATVKKFEGTRSSIFISPYLTVPLDGVNVLNEDGEWMKNADINKTTAQTAMVGIKVTVSVPPYDTDLSWKKRMISIIHSLDPQPDLQITRSPLKVVDKAADINGTIPYANPYFGAFVQLDSPEYRWYLDGYSFEPLAIRGMELTVICNGKSFPKYVAATPETGVPINSSFLITVEPGDVGTLKAFRNGKFQVTASYITTLSNTSTANVVTEITGYTAHLASEFRKEVQKASSSGSSFFIFSGSSSSVAQWMNNEASRSSSSFNKLSRTVVMKNVSDPILVAMVDEFAWPPTGREQVIENHLKAAAIAQSSGNKALADVHTHYAESLAKAAANDAPKVDTVKAAAALAEGDMLSFLASGVAVSNNSNSGSFTYRKLRSSTFSGEDIQRLNAMMIRSVEARNLASISDFPFQADISKLKDANEGQLNRQQLKDCVKKLQPTMAGPWLFEAIDLMFESEQK